MRNKETLVVCRIETPEIVSYLNVYEDDDEWLKIKGCETCSLENRKLCCGECPMLSSRGCFFHLDKTNAKPFRCVVQPSPLNCLKWCNLEFKCIKGIHKGLIRRVKDPNNELIKEQT